MASSSGRWKATGRTSWLDATYVKVRQGGRIVSLAVPIAVGINNDGRRAVLSPAVGCSKAETF
jgi:putative transposase